MESPRRASRTNRSFYRCTSSAEQAIALNQVDPQVEIQVTPVSEHTLRLSLAPTGSDTAKSIPSDGSLVKESWGTPVRASGQEAGRDISVGNFRLKISPSPVSIAIADEHDKPIQQFDWNSDTGVLTFLTGPSPLFGLREGGPQSDRRGSIISFRVITVIGTAFLPSRKEVPFS